MSRGFDDVYLMTKLQLEHRLNEGRNEEARHKTNHKRSASESMETDRPLAKKPRLASTSCVWYYKRKLDDEQVHGPFSSTNMLEWKAGGYFVGDNVVYLRRDPPRPMDVVVEEEPRGEVQDDADDLMNDLGDDDEEEEAAAVVGDKFVWFSSEQCQFE